MGITPVLTLLAANGLFLRMVFAALTHLRRKEPVITGVAAAVPWLSGRCARGEGLTHLALPG